MKFVFHRLFILALLDFIFTASGEISTTSEPFPGIAIHSETRTNPPTRLFVAEIDLTNPKLRLRVAPGGPDPDGDGKWETTLMLPTKIAAREKFDLVVNGDFFIARGVNDGEGTNSVFRAKQWALTEGPAMTDGKTWSTCTNVRPCLVVSTNQKVAIEMLTRPAIADWEVIGGNTLLVKDGVAVPHASKVRHPRTVVGFDAQKTNLVIMVVDGRKPGVAIGMNYDELTAEMIRLGCRDAVNLDGGGSSVMAVREAATDKMKILNEPTDGRERAVADVLGISVEK
jgi:exopolysaccharide biosynthesis protein